ncbi:MULTISPECIES: SMP-30/gluconolactonase/LRE family protein [unclassified Chelatococcus]|uniref:SMP-30/gluconolactonase/LRE family protein n=1 Tax=unclassified Chelatococcus TaxID=2638111 RepID=UPI0003815CE7|nr:MULTISPECIES: SMP-30/gluconolactonase/LRE family protein [unclassified Chelatococcus]ALA19961.1 IclR family transcriptional regulator [Chelatococcus sp. CO-6]
MDHRAHDRRGGRGAQRAAAVVRPEERDVPTGAAALAKGLYLLEVIGEAETPPRFKDLQAATGLPKGTLARMLNTLVLFRLVRHEESDSTYRLGHRLFELAHRVWESFDLRGAAAPVLDRLADEIAETVAIATIDADEVLYIDQRSRGGAFGFRIEVGRRAPLHCTAGGKALLAFAAPHEQRALLDRIRLTRHTANTIADEAALTAELALIRARGYAISVSEHVEGVSSAAAPIFDHTGKAIAVMGVFGPSARLPNDRLHVLGRDLMAAARQVSGNVGAAPMNITSQLGPGHGADPAVACVLPWGAHLAEGPVWIAGQERLYWVDILAPSANRFDPVTGENEELRLPQLISALLPRLGGGLVALTQTGLVGLDFATGATTPLVDPEADIPDNRFNDGKCDRQGRLWAGSMRLDASRTSGSLYVIEKDLSWRRVSSGYTAANGLDWSPDGRTLYFVDSVPGRIYAFDCDPETGTVENRRVFAEVPPEEGRPDGLAVDSDGFVWCALWDGWRVRRYAPDGRIDRDVGLPVPRPTSVAFGGADLKTLFITSARVRLPSRVLTEAPFSGGLFALPVAVPGLPTAAFAG